MIMADYYTDTKKKVVDFALGFLINLGLTIAVFVILILTGLLVYTFKIQSLLFTAGINGLTLLGAVAGEIILVYMFWKTRRYIAIGMLCFFIMPLLIFGMCMVALSNF
jgi:hypothetical protein